MVFGVDVLEGLEGTANRGFVAAIADARPALREEAVGGHEQQLMLAAIAGMLLFQSYLTASNIRPAVSGPVGGAQ